MKTELMVVKATKEFKQKVKHAAASDNQNMSEYITSCILFDLAIKNREGTIEYLKSKGKNEH